MNHDTNRNAGRFSVPLGSLQFKLTAAIMAVTLSFVWGLAIYAAATLQAQTRDVTMDAQFTMVEYLAAELDQKLKDRMTGLEGIARHLDLARLGDNAYLQQFLEQRYVLQQNFSGGTAIIAADGRALADYPITPGRRGTYFGDRDYVTQAAATRRSYIDKPVMGRTLKRPVLTMSTPLIDTAGEFKGVMTGIIDLTAADFLGLMADAKRLGSTEFYIISPRDGLFVTASDPKRIMTPLPAPGTSEIADSLSKGFEGSMVARSSQGITKLYSAKAVPTTGWVVELALPTEIAFRPAVRLRNTLYSSAALATLLALLVVAWMSRRLLKPLEDAAARLDDMSSGRQPLERLPENGDTEVHQLLGSFNRLIDHLAAQQAELRRNEVRLAASQRIAHVGSWEWEIASNTNVWSEETFRIFGLDPQGTTPSFEAFMNLIEADDRVRVASAKQRALDGLAPYKCEYRIRRPTGDVRVVHGEAEVVRDDRGVPLRMVGVNVDITERKLQEQEIRELNRDLEARVQRRTEDLERANRELEAFSYSISHDLRAPLRAINGFSKLVVDQEGTKLSADGLHMLGRVAHNAARMGELIDDILDYSRSGRAEMKSVVIDMDGLVRSVVEQARDNYPATEFRCDPLPPARGDPTLLRQVLLNLIDNAGKFSSRRTDARVEIGSSTANGETVFHVRDNGAGFDMRYADKLFGMFQRMHNSSQFPGTGVGLAIVKRLVERHGGRVWAESAPGQGATFYFALPASA